MSQAEVGVRSAGGAVRAGRARPEREGLPRWDYVSSGEHLGPSLEKDLARRAQSGDAGARDRMVNANIPLVVSIARQYGNPHMEPEDLIQEGMIGLCTAVERFDPGKGFRFSTYATYWIKQRVLRALDRQGRLIRLPVDVAYAARRAQQLR
jgi:DNA-directed RNA polymerase sigma subunit (sigma70/sigma32)